MYKDYVVTWKIINLFVYLHKIKLFNEYCWTVINKKSLTFYVIFFHTNYMNIMLHTLNTDRLS